MNVIGYVRVSTDKQDISIEDQRRKIEAYCEAHEINLEETYIDDGESGSKEDRPALRTALNHLTEVDGIIVYKLDRLTRSLVHLNELLEEHFKNGSELLVIKEKVDTSTATGRMMLNIMITISQWEVEVIRERTKAALRHKKENGERVGNIPYGKKLSDDGVHLEDDPKEQELIGLVVELREEGLSYRRIADRTYKEGYTNRNGNKLNKKSVMSIVKSNM